MIIPLTHENGKKVTIDTGNTHGLASFAKKGYFPDEEHKHLVVSPQDTEPENDAPPAEPKSFGDGEAELELTA